MGQESFGFFIVLCLKKTERNTSGSSGGSGKIGMLLYTKSRRRIDYAVRYD